MAVLRFLGTVKATDDTGKVWPLRVFQKTSAQSDGIHDNAGAKKIVTFAAGTFIRLRPATLSLPALELFFIPTLRNYSEIAVSALWPMPPLAVSREHWKSFFGEQPAKKPTSKPKKK